MDKFNHSEEFLNFTIKVEIEIKIEPLELNGGTLYNENTYDANYNQNLLDEDLSNFTVLKHSESLNKEEQYDLEPVVREEIKEAEVNEENKVEVKKEKEVKGRIEDNIDAKKEEKNNSETGFLSNLQNLKFPIILSRKLNIKDKKILYAHSDVVKQDQCDKYSEAPDVDDILIPNSSKYPDVEVQNDLNQSEDELRDAEEFEDLGCKDIEVQLEDNDSDENEKQILFKKLQDSKFPVVLLKRLRTEKENHTTDSENHGTSKLTSTPASRSCSYRSRRRDSTYAVSPPSNKGKKRNNSRFKRRSKFKDGVSCSKTTSSKKFSLEYHLSKHFYAKSPDCAFCNGTIIEKQKHFDLKNNTDFEVLQCIICTYKTKRKKLLKRHMLSHGKKFRCCFCNYSTGIKHYLKNHLLVHSEFKHLKCPHCKFKTNQNSNLRIHLLNHSDSKARQCSLCDYKTNDPSNFRRHNLTHSLTTGASPRSSTIGASPTNLFTCNDCNFVTNRKDNLKQHIFLHSTVKRFGCLKCDFESNRKDALRVHMTIHTKSKLFRCANCRYDTNHKSALRRHILRHHST